MVSGLGWESLIHLTNLQLESAGCPKLSWIWFPLFSLGPTGKEGEEKKEGLKEEQSSGGWAAE